MRVGDFSVEVVPHGPGRLRETASGHVLARPGQVYRLRLRNHGPLRAVVHLELDGRAITDSGLVLEPMRTMELERPVRHGEHGRFVVVAEGNESVFGPDGGRENDDLGLIDARFRRELPRNDWPISYDRARPTEARPISVFPQRLYRRMAPEALLRSNEDVVSRPDARFVDESSVFAAGTGLTGHSDQEFVRVHVGALETEATVIRLRLVVGTLEAIEAGDDVIRPIDAAPARPLARP